MKPRPSDTRLVIQPCRGCSARFTQSNKGPRLSSRDPPPSPPSLARTVGFHARVFQLSHVSLAAPPHVIPVAAGIQSPSPRHSRRSGNPEPLPPVILAAAGIQSPAPVILAAAGIQSPSPRHSRRSGNPEPLPPVILATAGIQSPAPVILAAAGIQSPLPGRTRPCQRAHAGGCSAVPRRSRRSENPDPVAEHRTDHV